MATRESDLSWRGAPFAPARERWATCARISCAGLGLGVGRAQLPVRYGRKRRAAPPARPGRSSGLVRISRLMRSKLLVGEALSSPLSQFCPGLGAWRGGVVWYERGAERTQPTTSRTTNNKPPNTPNTHPFHQSQHPSPMLTAETPLPQYGFCAGNRGKLTSEAI
jgi:hypothetical protein